MKRKLFAILLALTMIMQSSAYAMAAVKDDMPVSSEITDTLKGSENLIDGTSKGTASADESTSVDIGNGSDSEVLQPSPSENEDEVQNDSEIVNFEVQLQNDFPVKKSLAEKKDMFLVTLHANEPDVHEGEEKHFDTVSTVVDNTIIFRAANVPAGTYTLRMNSEYYFENFTQEVVINEGTKTTLMYSNSYTSNRGAGKTSPGVFALGDVNNDGAINSTDVETILQYMGQTETKTKLPDDANPSEEDSSKIKDKTFQSIYDLNLDGKTDIQDLSILAYNMGHEKQNAIPIVTVLQSAVKVEEAQEKAVPKGERKLDTIMEDVAEPIKIAPKEEGAAISEVNPVEIEMEMSGTAEVGGMVISAPADSGPTGGTIKVEVANPDDPEGKGEVIEVPIQDSQDVAEPVMQKESRMVRAARKAKGSSRATAIRNADGTIVIDLGSQVAIKKVTIVVTATAASTNLTEIAKVEFLNDMESRIPEPELNIPKNIEASGSGDSITVKWDAETNVTGYEVAVSAVAKDGTKYKERTYKAGVNQIIINSFEGGHKDKITPLWTYSIRVKSTNGNWSSPYSSKIEHYQLAGKAPEAPDNVSINGKHRQLDVSWKDMTGTEKYTLEYREKDAEEYIAVHDIMTNRYSITGLKDNTTYQVRVYGWNSDENGKLRRGPNSLPAVGKTANETPQFPKYGMISRDEIESIRNRYSVDNSKYPEGVKYDNEFLIDDDYSTYFHSTTGADIGATVVFKEEKTIKEVVVTNRLEDGYGDGSGSFFRIYITAHDANGKKESVGCSMQVLHPTAKNTIRYVLDRPVKAKQLDFGFHKYYNAACTISEIKYFNYDSLEDEVYGLYADDMHVSLKDTVTLEQIEALKQRANTKDAKWDEYHPKKDLLLSELDYAEELFRNGSSIGEVFNVNSKITTYGNASQFGMGLSGYQPLGYTAKSGSKINVYVGQKNRQIGQSVDARLVFTQYHAESAAWKSGEISLVQGKNEITIPNISSLDFEKGGSIYVVHTSPIGIAERPVEIRVSGATKIPVLDLYRNIGNDRATVDEAAWKSTIRTYLEELVKYNRNLSAKHSDHQEDVGGYEFGNGSNCFLNCTEISLDNVFISVPASQILNGLGGVNGNLDAMTDKMYNSMVAMNQMIETFYKQRGFYPLYTNGAKGIPAARFNIRYHRMFAGAFMYAGGLHLGIEWGSVPPLTGGSPIVTDENGKRIGGNMFGWGIAHEMGHDADVGGLTYAEVTNNIWAQFEKTWDTANTSRIPYQSVYKHVTSNTTGKPGNVFAQLGMYWQLHLAYDNNYAYYDYYKNEDGQIVYNEESYNNMLANEFFARYYLYRRDFNSAPSTETTLYSVRNGTTDQNIMRTACAAAQKDLTDFFSAWGMVVDTTTANYAAQFPKETRKLQYLNDAAHEYSLANRPAMTSTAVNAVLEQGVNKNARKVTLTITLPDEKNMDAVLGYEIIRNGKPVAFVQPATTEDGTYAASTVYTDVVETENNRVMTYGVVAYDKYLNATKKTDLEPIKIRHEGDLPSDNWTVTSINTVSNDGVLTVYEGTTPKDGNSYLDVATNEEKTYIPTMDVKYLDKDTGEIVRTDSAAKRIFDGDYGTAYNGTTKDNTAQMVISLGGRQEVLAIAVPDPASEGVAQGSTGLWKYILEFSNDGGASFTRMSSCVAGELADGRKVLYFKTDGNIKAFKATHFRITAPSRVKTLGFPEIMLLGPSGDNVDIGVSTVGEDGRETWNTENAIGILDHDYILDAESGSKIPEGSFIVTGKYAGNAAYNVVKLYNQDHKMFDDSFENKRDSIINGYQVFFADMPDTGCIANVKDGFWVYWLEPLSGENEGKYGLPGAGENGEDLVVELPTAVYAELYRVDNALTLAGERLVSDSFTVAVPETLPHITLTNSSTES